MFSYNGNAWATIVGKIEPTNLYHLRNMYASEGDFNGLLKFLNPEFVIE